MTHSPSEEIKKGKFIIEVTSYECDGDYYKTEVLGGLSKDEVFFVKEFLSYFKSSETGLGNTEIEDDGLSLAKEIAQNFKVSDDFVELFVDDDFHRLIGIWKNGEMWRCFARAAIYRVNTFSFKKYM